MGGSSSEIYQTVQTDIIQIRFHSLGKGSSVGIGVVLLLGLGIVLGEVLGN